MLYSLNFNLLLHYCFSKLANLNPSKAMSEDGETIPQQRPFSPMDRPNGRMGQNHHLNDQAMETDLNQSQSYATPMTLKIFRWALFVIGILTILLAVSVFTLDTGDVPKSTGSSWQGKPAKSSSHGNNIVLVGLMIGSACLLIGHLFSPRFIFVGCSITINLVLLIARIILTNSYRFSLMWIVLLEVIVSAGYAFVVFHDGQLKNEEICTTLLKVSYGGFK